MTAGQSLTICRKSTSTSQHASLIQLMLIQGPPHPTYKAQLTIKAAVEASMARLAWEER